MSNFTNLNVLKSACTDEWVAKTYSEYLLTCAKDKTALMDKITEVSTDPVLEELSDTITEECIPLCEYVDNAVFAAAEESGIDVSRMSKDDDNYRGHFTLLLGADDEFKAKVEELEETLGYNISSLTPIGFYNQRYADSTVDELVATSPRYKAELESKVDSALASLKYDADTTFTLNAGFVNLRDLFIKVVQHTEEMDGDFLINLKDSQDQFISEHNFSVEEFWSESKANLVSTLAWAQGFATIGVSDISDRLNTFEANIKSMVSDIGASFAASIANVKSRLATASMTVRDFIDQAGEQLGWSQLKNNNSVVDETDVAAYTGASPLSDLNLNTAKGVLTATARTIVAVGYGLWMGVKSLAKKVWGKVRPYVMAITNNPYDIKKISESNSYTIDGWCFNNTSTYDFRAEDIYNTSSSLEEYVNNINRYIDIVNKNVGSWLKFETVFGEALIKFNSVTPSEHITALTSLTWLSINATIQFKPRCMNYKTIGSYIGTLSDGALSILPLSYYSGAAHTWDNVDVNAAATSLSEFVKSNDLYADLDMAESEVHLGFMLGFDCFLRVLDYNYKEMCQQLQTGGKCFFRYSHYSGNTHPTNTTDLLGLRSISQDVLNISSRTVTNLNFMEVCAGLNKNHSADTSDWDFCSDYEWWRSIYDGTLSLIPRTATDNVSYFNGLFVPTLILSMLEIFGDKLDNPLDYTYYPYSSDQTDFNNPRYKIKTDAENKDVASVFYNILAIVALVVITVVIVGSVAKIAKNAAQSKARFKIGQLDSKIWKGKKLTPIQNWTYRRKTKKLAKLTSASSGLNSSSSAVETIQKVYETVTATQSANNSLGNLTYTPEGTPALVENETNTWNRYATVYKSITGIDLAFNNMND